MLRHYLKTCPNTS